jgi:hypothetical protein
MLENSVPFIKYCGTLTVSSTGTASLGWRANAAGTLFFAVHLDCFIVTRNFTAIYLDLVPFRSFIVTRSSSPFTRTGKKQVTATQTAPNQTAGPSDCLKTYWIC